MGERSWPVVFCRACQTVWLDDPATDPACKCLMTKPDWVTNPPAGAVPPTAWAAQARTRRFSASGRRVGPLT